MFDWLVRFYPRPFRERFEPGMRHAFMHDLSAARARGRSAAVRFQVLSALELTWNALVERAARQHTRSRLMRTSFLVDLRDAWRSLRATPLISLVAVASLGLGIGANTALFSVLNGLTLKPLPVHEPERLVYLEFGAGTNPIWEELRDRYQRLYDGAFAWAQARFDTAPAGESQAVDGLYASGGMFRVLGVQAFLGRTFDERDDRHGGGDEGAVAVISHRYWRERFNASPSVLGETLYVERKPFTIVGVTPPGFTGPDVGTAADIMIPLGAERIIKGAESALTNRSDWWLEMMFRLRPGQTPESFAAELNAARPLVREATMPADWPAAELETYLSEPINVRPGGMGRSSLRARFAEPLTIVLAIVGVVLVIACANIASLLLARAVSRRHELSVRVALGASRVRVARQLLAEGAMLACAGSVLGLALAQAGGRAIVSQLSTWSYNAHLDLSLDWRVLVFVAGVSLLTVLLFGLAPVVSLSSISPNEALKERGRGMTADRAGGFRNALVIAQVALSLALVAAAGLLVRSYATLSARDRGFTRGDVLIARVNLQQTQVDAANRVQAFQRLRDAAAGVPGVASAAVSYMTPVSGRGWGEEVLAESTGTGVGGVTWLNIVTPGWFATYGVDLLEGRDVSAADRLGGQRVAVVDRTFAQKYLAPGPVVGQRFALSGLDGAESYEVIGLVENTLYRSLKAAASPTIFRPVGQWDRPGAVVSVSVTAASGDPRALSRQVAAALEREVPNARVDATLLSDHVSASVIQERLVAVLSGFFGVLALVLAALGIYGVAAYGVSRRLREIGIRMALGADKGLVVRMVLRRLGALMVAGLAAGALLSWWASKYIATLLYEVEPTDPATLAGAIAVLASVGLLAGWMPARRAASVDPTVVLRD